MGRGQFLAVELWKAQNCARCHIGPDEARLWSDHRICPKEGVMMTIHRQTKRITAWLNRATTSSGELKHFSDRALQDIGLSRYRTGADAYKPFWMV